MADVKWIKITTDIFDDEKILIIESMPASDNIIVIWFKLLVLAGKQNNDGVFMMSNRIAYTDEMLAAIFRRNINTVKLALSTFERLGMIEIVNDVITIPNWNKHQTLDSYEKKKERDKIYQAERRTKQRALIQESSDASSDSRLTVARQSSDSRLTASDASSCVAVSEEDIDKDIDIDLKKEIYKEKKAASGEASNPPKKHKYGEYKNVLLSDNELEKLKAEFPDWQERIERLSSYVASTGKSYKNHLATIRNWARKDSEKGGQKNADYSGVVDHITDKIGIWL